jgi:hypothetical protein
VKPTPIGVKAATESGHHTTILDLFGRSGRKHLLGLAVDVKAKVRTLAIRRRPGLSVKRRLGGRGFIGQPLDEVNRAKYAAHGLPAFA